MNVWLCSPLTSSRSERLFKFADLMFSCPWKRFSLLLRFFEYFGRAACKQILFTSGWPIQRKRSVSKMKVQVVTINSAQESSKLDLSSRGERPFKFADLMFL